jgi:hypothetical protein
MTTTYITVTWKKLGSAFTYNVFYSSGDSDKWIRHNDMILTEDNLALRVEYDGTNNVYRLDGLEKNTIYKIKVTCHDLYNSLRYSYTSYDSVEYDIVPLNEEPAVGNLAHFTIYIGEEEPEGFGHGEFGQIQFGI